VEADAGARVAALQSALMGNRRAARSATPDDVHAPEVVDPTRSADPGRDAASAPARSAPTVTPAAREASLPAGATPEDPVRAETPATTPRTPAGDAGGDGKPSPAADAVPAREGAGIEAAPRSQGAEAVIPSGPEVRATEGKAESPVRPASAATPLPASLRPAELPERSVHLLRELRQNGEDSYRATLRLDPPALGKLRIELRVDGDRSWTRLTVESHAAREHLQGELPRIRALMEQQGLGEARVEVQLRQGDGQHPQSDGQGPRSGGSAQGAEPASEEPGSSAWIRHDGLIDLRA
jgi:flagellar hook-length control protein FliK